MSKLIRAAGWITGYCAAPLTFVLVSAFFLAGCGMVQRSAPLEVWDDMKRQEKFGPQQANTMFADGRASRMPVEGTIARGVLRDESPLYTGRVNATMYVGQSPVAITKETLQQGRKKFNVYCAPCHSEDGTGKGIVPTRFNAWQVTSLHEDRLRVTSDGDIFNVITHGRRTMPSYRTQIEPGDRWAIVAYVRALQRSTGATTADVPESVRAGLK
jgi:mono/diheme cytochrome c family protein